MRLNPIRSSLTFRGVTPIVTPKDKSVEEISKKLYQQTENDFRLLDYTEYYQNFPIKGPLSRAVDDGNKVALLITDDHHGEHLKHHSKIQENIEKSKQPSNPWVIENKENINHSDHEITRHVHTHEYIELDGPDDKEGMEELAGIVDGYVEEEFDCDCEDWPCGDEISD